MGKPGANLSSHGSSICLDRRSPASLKTPERATNPASEVKRMASQAQATERAKGPDEYDRAIVETAPESLLVLDRDLRVKTGGFQALSLR